MKLRTLLFAAAPAVFGVAVYGQALGSSELLGSQERITYFSGTVAMEDGSAPPDAVQLQRVCKGIPRDEGWTDAKGHFSFKVGRNDRGSGSGDATEASARPADLGRAIGYNTQLSNPITSELRDCDLQAVLAGYRAQRVSLNVESVGAKNLGTVVLHPISRISTLTVSATTLQAPSNARKAYDKGLEAMQAKKWEAAAGEFAKAVKAYPKFAVAWYQLGEARLAQNNVPSAIEAWRSSANADPKYIKPLEKLTAFADQNQKWTEAAADSDAWLKLDADDFPGAWLFNAIAKAQLGRMEEAEHSAREGLRVDKDQRIPRLSYILGLILLQEHKYGESAECFRHYIKLAPNARDADVVRQQLAEFDKLAASGPGRTP